jgi:hypothetical protein
LKRQVVRPVRNSLQVREFVGKWFSPGEGVHTSYRALRILVQPVVEDPREGR